MSLLAWYKFNSDLTDSSGNGYNGVLSGSVSYSSTAPKTYALTGTGHSTINMGSFPTTGTISFWVRADATVTHASQCVFATDDDNTFNCIRVQLTTGPVYQLIVGNAGTATTHALNTVEHMTYATGSSTISAGWVHITITWNKNTNIVQGYINTKKVFENANTTWPTGSFADFVILRGYNTTAAYQWSGLVSDFRVYDNVLTLEDIISVYLYNNINTTDYSFATTLVRAKNTIILDNYSRNNFSLETYNSGESYVRNYIVINKRSTNSSYIICRTNSGSKTFKIYIKSTEYSAGSVTTAGIFSYVRETTALVDAGFKVEYYIDDPTYVLITNDGTTDSRDIKVFFESGDVYNIGTYQNTYAIMNVFSDNQDFYAEDTVSIAKYGRRILTVENYELFTLGKDLQTMLTNKLDQYKDPKARMVVHVPFNYENIDLLDTIEVRLSFQNTSQLNNFREGGAWLSWTEHEDGYRYKSFLVTGIRHAQDGEYTSLTLMEKI